MPFNEEVKLSIRRRAHFMCCMCKAIGVEIHHIVPQAEGGLDTEDNGAPLCPSCHETYGANPIKRKFIREMRDHWYEICDTRFKENPDLLASLSDKLQQAATKSDLEKAVSAISERLNQIANDSTRSIPQRQDILARSAGVLGGVSANRHCTHCNSFFGLLVGDQGRCPQCGAPW